MAIDPTTKAGARALSRLPNERIAWLTTVTPDGQPQTAPVWFLFEGGEILIYGLTTGRRNRNLAANPRVTFHLDDDGSGDDIVSFEGIARVDDATPAAHEHPAYLAKYGDWIAKYEWTPEWFASQYSVPIRISPTHLFGG